GGVGLPAPEAEMDGETVANLASAVGKPAVEQEDLASDDAGVRMIPKVPKQRQMPIGEKSDPGTHKHDDIPCRRPCTCLDERPETGIRRPGDCLNAICSELGAAGCRNLRR